MKRAVILVEAAAGVPEDALGGRTPLEVARCPSADRMASGGQTGHMAPEWKGKPFRPELLLACLSGAEPTRDARLRRGPVEAHAVFQGVEETAYAYRGELVTLDGDRLLDARLKNCTLEETASLAQALQDAEEEPGLQYGVAGPATLSVLLPTEPERTEEGMAPCLVEGASVREAVARGSAGGFPRRVLEYSRRVLAAHPVNDVRIDLGENPANALWVWGGGSMARTRAFGGGGKGACLLGSDPLSRGWAALRGMTFLDLGDPWRPGDAGPCFRLCDLVEAVRAHDLLVVRVPAPGKFGSYGDPARKVRSLENMDRRLLDPLLNVLEAEAPFRVLLVAEPDEQAGRMTPLPAGIPFVLHGEGVLAGGHGTWHETAPAGTTLQMLDPDDLRQKLKEGD